MKKRVAYYVSRKNPLIWLAALVMLASAALRIANVCGKGADAKTVWFLVVLPVVGCVFYVLNILCNGMDRFYRSSVPVILLAIYYGIKITLVSPYLWLTFVFWIAYLAIAAFYAVTVSGHIKSTIPLLLLLIAALGILAGALTAAEAASPILPSGFVRWLLLAVIFVLGGVLFAVIQYAPAAYYQGKWPQAGLAAACAAALLAMAQLGEGVLVMLLVIACEVLIGVLTLHGGRRTAFGDEIVAQALGYRKFLRRVTQSQLQSRLAQDIAFNVGFSIANK